MAIIILDTDVGLDDAAAILLGQNEDIKPAYYICTEGNTSADGVVRNVRILDKYLGLKARIVKGCEVHPSKTGHFYGKDALANLSEEMIKDLHISQEDIKPDLSYEEFKKNILQYDHITYIAIGPLTTLSDLIQNEEIKKRIDDIYIMGGGIMEFNSPNDTEFNFHQNPEAVCKVLTSGLNISLFPLDLTIHQKINDLQIKELESSGKYPEYIDMFRFIKKQTFKYDNIDAAILHDTMPVLYCSYPTEFTTEDVTIKCDLDGHLTIEEDGYNLHLVTDVSPSLLYDCLKKAFDLKI